MPRAACLAIAAALLACAACNTVETRGAQAKKALADPLPAVRAAAAAELRKLEIEQPEAIGDHGQAHWQSVLSSVPAGADSGAMVHATGSVPGSYAVEGPAATGFRLDDFWVVVAELDGSQRLSRFEPVMRAPLTVDAPRWPAGYSGEWRGYRVSGSLFSSTTVEADRVTRYRVFHDNGQPSYEERYRDGKLEGDSLGFHPNGKQAYERHYRAGIQVGPAREWHDNGALWIEVTYVAGKPDGPEQHFRDDGSKEVLFIYSAGEEEGQAAWDHDGSLLYARGAAQAALRDAH